VHAHSGEAAAVAACYWRAPLLVSYLGDDLLGSPRLDASVSPVWKLRRTVVRRLTGLANRTITKSREMETVLPLHVRARNTVLPNGVDTDLFRPIDGSLARRQLGWEVDRPIVLFAANPAVPRKRYFLAEAAVERARSELPGLKLKVARGVTPDHMPLLMNAADCLLLTSSVEGSPNVVKEALMCNLPVVATPSGDVAELLDGVEPSYLCPPSEAALADALVDCLREPKRSNGREVSARLDATVIADSLIRIYKEIAPGIELLTAARHESAAAETAS
jgi:glycosyltransferase involved in cell wall biosynthesis